MLFSPSGMSRMAAVPLGVPAMRSTAWVSMPSACSAASSAAPWASCPTAPSIATRAPWRAAATAWLAPLPPPSVSKPLPVSVSPGAGRRGVRMRRSMFRLPTTSTSAGGAAKGSLIGVSWIADQGAGLPRSPRGSGRPQNGQAP